MSENNEANSFAATGSGKSEPEVAFDLLNKLKGQGVWGERNVGAILDLYAECLDAAKGLRAYEGQKRVEVPTHTLQAKRPAETAAAPVQQSAPQQQAPIQTQSVQAPQAQMAQAPAQQPIQQQPVHAQQQVLQQAFKQG